MDLGDAAADGGVDAELFIKFAGKGLLSGLAGLDLTARELPLKTHRLVRLTLADENLDGLGCAGWRLTQHECSYDQAQGP